MMVYPYFIAQNIRNKMIGSIFGIVISLYWYKFIRVFSRSLSPHFPQSNSIWPESTSLQYSTKTIDIEPNILYILFYDTIFCSKKCWNYFFLDSQMFANFKLLKINPLFTILTPKTPSRHLVNGSITVSLSSLGYVMTCTNSSGLSNAIPQTQLQGLSLCYLIFPNYFVLSCWQSNLLTSCTQRTKEEAKKRN